MIGYSLRECIKNLIVISLLHESEIAPNQNKPGVGVKFWGKGQTNVGAGGTLLMCSFYGRWYLYFAAYTISLLRAL